MPAIKKSAPRKTAITATVRPARKEAQNIAPFNITGTSVQIPVELIDPNPFQNRQQYNVAEMREFIADVKRHGVLSPVTTRATPEGRYQLAAGERRVQASRACDFETVPAIVRELTDAEMVEILISENLHRENLHPLDEAAGIATMQRYYKKAKEIALRVGKSETFVKTRLKLLQLVEPIKEVFFANKITMQDALSIAVVSKESQTELYDAMLSGWAQPDFVAPDLRRKLQSLRCELSNAPFPLDDKKLIPKAGACLTCPFNTAVLSSLFPEYAQQSFCTNRGCFAAKSKANFLRDVRRVCGERIPVAFISYDSLEDYETEVLEELAGENEVLDLSPRELDVLHLPVMPTRESFTSTAEDGTTTIDEAAFLAALALAENEAETFYHLLDEGEYQPALFSEKCVLSLTGFREKQSAVAAPPRQTAAEVREAIADNTITADMLTREMERLRNAEEEETRRDQHRLAREINNAFRATVEHLDCLIAPTEADELYLRLLVFETLPEGERTAVEKKFFAERPEDQSVAQWRYWNLFKLTPEQFGAMLRLCIIYSYNARNADQAAFIAVWDMAESIGIATGDFENKVQAEAAARKQVLETRLAHLQALADRVAASELLPVELMEEPEPPASTWRQWTTNNENDETDDTQPAPKSPDAPETVTPEQEEPVEEEPEVHEAPGDSNLVDHSTETPEDTDPAEEAPEALEDDQDDEAVAA